MGAFLQKVTQEGGWKLTCRPSVNLEGEWRRTKQRLEDFGPQFLLEEGFGDLSFEIILDSKEVRIVEREEARAFWSSWTSSLPRPPK